MFSYPTPFLLLWSKASSLLAGFPQEPPTLVPWFYFVFYSLFPHDSQNESSETLNYIKNLSLLLPQWFLITLRSNADAFQRPSVTWLLATSLVFYPFHLLLIAFQPHWPFYCSSDSLCMLSPKGLKLLKLQFPLYKGDICIVESFCLMMLGEITMD